MKAIFWLTTILLLNLSVIGQVNMIPEDAKFSSDARVEFTKDPVPERRKTGELPPFEPKAYSIGTTNGIPYLFYFANGTGEIEGSKGRGVDLNIDHRDDRNWTLLCSRTARGNDKHCGVGKADLMVINAVTKDGKSILWLTTLSITGEGDSPVTITVDDGTMYARTDKGQYPTTVIDEMKTGKQVTVRKAGGSKGPDVVVRFDLHGFKVALAICEWAVKQID